MKTMQTIDLYLWKHVIPEIKPSLFKVKIISFFALIYISLFPMPRKFIRHYFKGRGLAMPVDTRAVVIANHEVFDCLLASIKESYLSDQERNSIDIPQILVSNPNYKYSIGSLSLNYIIENEMLSIRLESNYHFARNNDRITRHLHNWLVSFKENGTARNFDVEGNVWTLPYSDLTSVQADKGNKKYVDLNRLYL